MLKHIILWKLEERRSPCGGKIRLLVKSKLAMDNLAD